MIDHLTFGVSDFGRSTAFYDRAFAPLGLRRIFDDPRPDVRATGYGDTRPFFWIAEQDPTSGKLHVAIRAESREAVDAFHQAALAAGGVDNGGPGLRPHYHPGYYGAFVLDPDGHNIEAVFHDPALSGTVSPD
ncbi:VOC family protein [Phenylobacterium sp. J426]|uniref:VOC family protein n=1 Tax=Phenylobacterium sp. J426 TaxID=2898439 RepID=UPI0021507742|nr:VOC family protein [Phenylobacterium sp. J426]MCR5873034.1 VOC family protein [Phenylobacterium sp. J426]